MKKGNITSNSNQTKKLGEKFAKEILKKGVNVVIGLQGELGSGKTTFIQGFAKGLGIKEKILSPTFIIYKSYPLPTTNYKLFYHFDCYRIQKSS